MGGIVYPWFTSQGWVQRAHLGELYIYIYNFVHFNFTSPPKFGRGGEGGGVSYFLKRFIYLIIFDHIQEEDKVSTAGYLPHG